MLSKIRIFLVSLSARRAWIEIHLRRSANASPAVALRKESVDRNGCLLDWDAIGYTVALRKESVDRNAELSGGVRAAYRSLSARRAWIEIHVPFYPKSSDTVALRKESVDRNHGHMHQGQHFIGRSPQGERG